MSDKIESEIESFQRSAPLEKENIFNKKIILSDDEQKLVSKYLRKIDMRILPIMTLIYILAQIDKSNIGAALVNGLTEHLKFTKNEQANITTLFYVTYILFDVPNNILLKNFRPHIWFGLIGICWGLTCVGLAFAKVPATFILARMVLGALECGVAPGIIGYLNYWYTRKEVGYRTTIFFLAVPLSGIFGSPLAGALASVKSKHFEGYQVIFLVEGLITVAVCFVAYFIIIDYPDESKFLTDNERELCVRRLRADVGLATKTKASFSQTVKSLTDWKMWIFAITYFGINNSYVVISLFMPTIIKGLGYSGTTATYLTTIPYIAGLIGALFAMFLISKMSFHKVIILYGLIAIIGYIGACFGKGKAFRITFIAIAGFGSMSNIPMFQNWMSINQGNVYKSLLGAAFTNSIGSIGGVVSPKLFVSAYGPNYTTGIIYCICVLLFSLILVASLTFYFDQTNKKRERDNVDVSHLSEVEQRELQDLHPNFRYIL
ncbi:putative transporter [Smittium culicis]|uniref:Putative transporter n=1 Tax=Smittium culicis TaxID=133412 RepID=A0A1R1XV20_9FUNG|nr:putative transporter [Smittium culicis]